ncbi:hypothetical protein AKJ16_DCAP22889 [Drosera capensis]
MMRTEELPMTRIFSARCRNCYRSMNMPSWCTAWLTAQAIQDPNAIPLQAVAILPSMPPTLITSQYQLLIFVVVQLSNNNDSVDELLLTPSSAYAIQTIETRSKHTAARCHWKQRDHDWVFVCLSTTPSMADEGNNGTAGEAKAAVFSALKTQLLVSKVGDAVEFLKSAYGAEEVGRIVHLKRKAEQDEPLVVSAEMKIGESVFSVVAADETGDNAVKPDNAGLVLSLETEGVDAAVAKAVGAGAVAVGEVTDEDAAGRVGKVKDPFGFVWEISSGKVTAPAAEEEKKSGDGVEA